jgi:threonine/homoserine/homoserine lactone efflux protein
VGLLFEDVGIFLRGLVLGLMIAAPVGPVGLLCIRRTLKKGLLAGFTAGFGAAFADGLFSAIAAFGISAITELLKTYNDALHVLGGVIMLFIAWHAWRDKPRHANTEEVEERFLKRAHLRLGGAVKAIATSFFITLTNPATLFGVLAVIATLGGLDGTRASSALVLGIFLGSSLWWALLSGGVSLVRHRFTDERVMTINRFTSVALTVLAIGVLIVGGLRLAGVEIPSL